MSKPKQRISKGTLSRLIKELWKYYPGRWVYVFICMVFVVLGNSCASVFIKQVAVIVNKGLTSGFDAVKGDLYQLILIMIVIYILAVVAAWQMKNSLAVITQGSIYKIRMKMFTNMQKLPIKYFDQNTNGEIMSHYTNDTDNLRELISGSITAVIQSVTMLVVLFFIMISNSIWLSLIILAGVVSMFLVMKSVGSNASRGFINQQRDLAKVEGFIEESMNGQKVIKVFCHEEESEKKFNELNENLCQSMDFAHSNSNRMGPIMGNIGNIMYVSIAFLGGILLALSISGKEVYNFTITGFTLIELSTFLPVVISFLTLARQFSNNVNQVAQQFNSIAMSLAAADRIFRLIDQQPEVDEGYVTLVHAQYDEDKNLVESYHKTHIWAWKHPHKDGTVTYTKLTGDIRMKDVDFSYVPEKLVLKNVSLYAEPGQRVAFVGATGAGKTTITNLINRFYDIADGKIRYDGININKIKKADLRKSLGIVLQDTNLFTGTVMENIRYGRLDATDEECIEAAKLANAHDFITRLPNGYQTMLTSDGANLSQGQRQLLSIARAAVADAPVMILDEATSSIDTRTELLVQQGTDKLMKGRTVFVIAHRLSTVQSADVIMVLEHGEIIERGTHDELIKKQGKYYQLYTGAFELE